MTKETTIGITMFIIILIIGAIYFFIFYPKQQLERKCFEDIAKEFCSKNNCGYFGASSGYKFNIINYSNKEHESSEFTNEEIERCIENE